MIIVGCDYHPSFQPIAFVDTENRRAAKGETGSPSKCLTAPTLSEMPDFNSQPENYRVYRIAHAIVF